MGIQSVLFQQRLMGTLLCDLTVFQDTDTVSIHDGGQSVCDHDHGLACGKLRKRLLYLRLVIGICKCCSFIQDQDRCIFNIALAMDRRCASPPDT